MSSHDSSSYNARASHARAVGGLSRRAFLEVGGLLGLGLVGLAEGGVRALAADSAAADAAPAKNYGKFDIPGKNGSLCNAPAYIAYDQGFFKEEGFDINLVTADFETRKVGLNNGNIPIVNGDFQFFPSMENGINARVVDGLNYGCIKLEVLPDSDIKTAADLKGKKIGVDEIGGTPYQIAALWLEQAGISSDPAKGEVQFLPFNDANLEFQALTSKQIDVAALWDPVASIKEKSGEGKVILDIGKDEPFASKYCCFLFGSAKWLDEDRERAAALLRAYHKAQDWIAKNPEEAAKIIAEKQYSAITDQDLAVQLLKGYKYPTLEDRAAGKSQFENDVKYFADELQKANLLQENGEDFSKNQVVVLDTGDDANAAANATTGEVSGFVASSAKDAAASSAKEKKAASSADASSSAHH